MISLTTVLVVAAICVFVEGFFSGSEIAMVSADRVAIKKRAQNGEVGARLVESFLQEPQMMLATTLCGTNLATVTFSVTVALYLVMSEAANSEILAVVMVTPVTLILGEVVPKTLFRQHADTLVTKIIYPLRVASLVLRPVVLVMGGFANMMTRLVGIDKGRAFVTREELAFLIEAEGSDRSEITENEREMIANVFELTEATVEDVMLPLSEVTALSVDATVGEAAREVADKQHSRMPVYRKRVDDIVGVLNAFDLLASGALDNADPIVDLVQPANFVPENKPAVDLLVELQGTGNQLAIVVDEYGGAIGIVSVEDLLEEIVGEIEDEHDDEVSPLTSVRPGVWRIRGKTSVERVNNELSLELPEGEYESLAGLLLDHFKRIPNDGESMVVAGVTLRVVSSSDRAIEEVQLLRRRKR